MYSLRIPMLHVLTFISAVGSPIRMYANAQTFASASTLHECVPLVCDGWIRTTVIITARPACLHFSFYLIPILISLRCHRLFRKSFDKQSSRLSIVVHRSNNKYQPISTDHGRQGAKRATFADRSRTKTLASAFFSAVLPIHSKLAQIGSPVFLFVFHFATHKQENSKLLLSFVAFELFTLRLSLCARVVALVSHQSFSRVTVKHNGWRERNVIFLTNVSLLYDCLCFVCVCVCASLAGVG